MRVKKKVMCRIFIEKRKHGTVWVPYKTLMGYGIGNRVIIGSRGEHVYGGAECGIREHAIEAAKAKAREVIAAKFDGVAEEDIEWHIVDEAAPLPIAV